SSGSRHRDGYRNADRLRDVSLVPLDDLPRIHVFEDARGKRRVQGVAGTVRHEVADHRVAAERAIADRVEDLGADELVLEAEGVVQRAVLPDHDALVERAAEREAALAEHLDFLQEAERPRRRDLLDEAVLGDPHRPRLVADKRVIYATAVVDLEMIGGVERNPLVPLAQRNRPQHLEELLRRRQLLDARLVQHEVDERGGAAVHDRHFRAVQLDDDVVDAERRQGGEQVLDRLHRHRFTSQSCRELNASKMRDRCRHFQPAEVGALETDAEVGRRGLERKRDLVAGMKTYSGTGDGATKSALGDHDLSKTGDATPSTANGLPAQTGSQESF